MVVLLMAKIVTLGALAVRLWRSAPGFNDDTSGDFGGPAGEAKTAPTELLLVEHRLTFRGAQVAATQQSLATARAKLALEIGDQALGRRECGFDGFRRRGAPKR